MSVEKKFCVKIYPEDFSLDKKWFVYWNITEKGRRVRKKKYGDINSFSSFSDRMKAAIKLKDSILNEYSGNNSVKKDAYQFISDLQPTWRKKTYQTIKSKLDTFYTAHGDHTPTKESMSVFFTSLKKRLHATTYNDYLRQLKMIFGDYPEWFEEIKKLKNICTPARYFQRHQVKRLHKYMMEHDPELWLFCMFQYYCFIRPNSELRLMKVGDLMLDENKILVPGNISKNKKSEYVVVPNVFRKQLEHYKYCNANEYLFPHPDDSTKPRSYNHFGNKHRKVLKALGFSSEYKLYSWKHTGAVSCIKANINIKELQIQLRHHSLEEVDKYLRQLGVSDLRKLESDFPAAA